MDGTLQSYTEAKTNAIQRFEMRYIEAVLQAASGNISQAARRSGLSRSSLQRIIRRLNIDVDCFRSEA